MSGVYRIPFWDVTQGWYIHGNWDDPSGSGHSIGQPYAWDIIFSHPVEYYGQIYCARAGTVIDLRNNITQNINYSDPVLGPGNYIIIEHADKTISAYDHLKANSITVSVGQYVEQATLLGIVGNTGTSSTTHLHFEALTWFSNGGTVADPLDDSGGASLLIHFENTTYPTLRWRPVTYDTPPLNPLKYRQDGWRFCYRCAGLFFSWQGQNGHCSNPLVPNGPHVTTGGNYTLSDDVTASGEAGWKHCSKCRTLFYAPSIATSNCPVTTPTSTHDGTGSGTYRIIKDVPGDPGQHGWRHCSKCKGMVFGSAASSVCPEDGGLHVHSAGDYSLWLTLEDTQQGWKRCSKCRGLYFPASGSTSGGVCPVDGLVHTAVSSGGQTWYYTLCVDVSPVNASGAQQDSVPPDSTGWQGGWRFCNKCRALFNGANESTSNCPADNGTHSGSSSGNYFLLISNLTVGNQGGLGEVGWRRCSKCEGIWLPGGSSTCPADNGAHNTTGSSNYILCVDVH